MSIGEIIRDKYSKDLERKTRNVFFLCSSTRGADYYVFIGNNNSVIGILEILNYGTDLESKRWIIK